MVEALSFSMPLLELREIAKDFPGVRALDGVSFDLEAGEVHALCGENGAGKSTLIKALCGCFPSGSFGGQILLAGQPAHFGNLRAAEEHGIALIAQELALVPELSVAENLSLGQEPVRRGLIRWELVRSQARRALERVGLAIDPERPVRELGIGQQQLVEIAKALAKNARVLVLDEPTAALTEADAERLLAVLRDLRSRGVAAIYISHRLQEVFEIADRITVLRDGRSVGTERTHLLTRDRVIALMVGRQVDQLCQRSSAPSRDVVLRVAGWSVTDPDNPGRHVVKDVGLEVRAGEVLGIGGLMGAGRTALLSSPFGAARSSVGGELRLAGRSSAAPFVSPAEAIASGVALVSEDRKRFGLLLEAGVAENLTLVALRHFSRGGFLDGAAQARAASEQCRSLRIKAPGLATWVGQLSGGNQQKVVLGKWLLAKPRLLLLDEPTRGIDVGAKAEIYGLVNQLAESGLAVILVSSELPELLGLSHRILVLSQGRPTAEIKGAQATPERVMAAATAKA